MEHRVRLMVTKAKTKNDLMLEQLIMAVSTKHPGETRFETALRYIKQAEQQDNIHTKNQCDGCSQGLPVVDGLHRTKEDKPFMCCTKNHYT